MEAQALAVHLIETFEFSIPEDKPKILVSFLDDFFKSPANYIPACAYRRHDAHDRRAHGERRTDAFAYQASLRVRLK